MFLLYGRKWSADALTATDDVITGGLPQNLTKYSNRSSKKPLYSQQGDSSANELLAARRLIGPQGDHGWFLLLNSLTFTVIKAKSLKIPPTKQM